MTDARFEACLPIILRWEGGNDDDPHDHGGRTSRGITQREYDLWRTKRGQAKRDVWQASNEEIRAIYFEEYWLPKCPRLAVGVDLMYFNAAVNAGPGQADKFLVRSIGGTDAETVERYYQNSSAFYHALKQWDRYGRGWMNRLNDVHRQAAKDAASAGGIAKPVEAAKPAPAPAPPPPPKTAPEPPAATPEPSVWSTVFRRLFFRG